MRDNPQNTISTIAIKKYNDFRSLRIKALEWVKVTNSESKSAWISTIRYKGESKTLDDIKIDLTRSSMPFTI